MEFLGESLANISYVALLGAKSSVDFLDFQVANVSYRPSRAYSRIQISTFL